MNTSRRGFFSAATLSTAGLVAAAAGIESLIPNKAEAAGIGSTESGFKKQPEELEDFVFDIEHGSEGFVGSGGTAKEATVDEFPVSKSIAGVSMRLNPGGFRELHWHSIAAEWAFVLEGRVRTTVITPDGTTSNDDFEVGDIWYFPKGYGHALQCIGNEPCFFMLAFDNGHFSEFGTFSLTDWMSHTSPEILAHNSGLPANTFASIPKKELYIGTGKIAPEAKPHNLDTNIPVSFSSHKFRMEKDGVRTDFKGGYHIIVSSLEFPIQTSLTAIRLNIEPGAIRELHWHPNADEWQYVMSGQGRVGIFGSHSRVKTMDYDKGKIAFIRQGYGHYVENTGK